MTAAQPDDLVRYEAADGVAELTLNRPSEANAIDLETAHALKTNVERAASDDSVNVVLLLGAGQRFCGGGDLAAMAASADRSDYLAELAGTAHDAIRALDTVAKPVVAGVQGAAAGIGLSLVLGADLVVAGASAKFVTAYTSVGLTPDGGQSWLLPRIVGQRRALELILTSAPLTATRAEEWGIVSTVCDDDDVVATARQAAASLAARPAQALGAARSLVRQSWDRPLNEQLDVEAASISYAVGTPESTALVDRFVTKRYP
ncbi:enoyl-CoA hydratase/isomerase family protein [Tsukamurella sp. 8F]|uniref:enoyl-CoA hydratase/isomerase family protein n=1 Tax=unclassified Tsukamurella TaxID=2633480 RepID=UPI0023B95CCA|nr:MULTISPECIES: enoyl-CoA hydratase/isomerase family protein [unclassified Tsukamurella]MDF0528878.1 enoyl-CoA hydratase/isomerase family protein [Tsukamurella sp. 8J]MDF0586713.1 enoyl-CoA hydratase/isomerase family protein [Tsukamurella sp. 8F]